MPNSVSSNGSSTRTGSIGRLRTSGNVSHSHHESSSLHGSHLSRRRSPSPTDHLLERQANADRLQDRLFALNQFIYRGVDKFLDRQAVRDLITAFDANDIFTAEGGLESDFFSWSLSVDQPPEEEHLLTIFQQQGKTVFVQQQSIKTNSQRRAAFKSSKKSLSSGGKSLLRQFVGIIRVKLFNIQHRQNSAAAALQKSQFDFEDSDDKETAAAAVNNAFCCC